MVTQSEDVIKTPNLITNLLSDGVDALWLASASVAARMGYADALAGISEFNGYQFFAGARLAEYLAGHGIGAQLAEGTVI